MKREALTDGTFRLDFRFATIQDFMYVLMNTLPDHQIVDETGLKGEYDFSLTLPAEAFGESVEPGDISAAFFKAINSIGLQISRQRAPIRIVVIDHIDKPTDN